MNKIVVVGAGNVGESIGYTLVLKRQANEVSFVDLDAPKAYGAALDVAHATTYVGKVRVKSGGYEECADADCIIITAGARRKPGQTRLDLAKVNISIMTSITKSIVEHAKKDPFIIVVSNPVDLMTYVVQKVSGYPIHKVIGSGTALDTARFRYMIADKLGVDVNDVNSFMLGEHGDSMVPIWSRTTIAGEPIEEFLKNNPEVGEFNYDEIEEKTKKAGSEIINAKGATFYGVAMATSRIVDALNGNESALMSVSHVFNEGFTDLKEFAVSMVCKVGSNGIEKTLDYSMSEKEYDKVYSSAKMMSEFVQSCFAEEN